MDGDLWRSYDRQWQQVLQRGPDDWPTMEIQSKFEESMVDFEAVCIKLWKLLAWTKFPAALKHCTLFVIKTSTMPYRICTYKGRQPRRVLANWVF